MYVTQEQLEQLLEPVARHLARLNDEVAALNGALVRLLHRMNSTTRCAECGRAAVDDDERGWKAYLTSDEPPALAMFCPECAEREFGDDRG